MIITDARYIRFNLQMFSSEDEGRTEDPLPRRLHDARRRGQVAKTQELAGTLVVLFGILVFTLFSNRQFTLLQNYFAQVFTTAGLIAAQGFSIDDVTGILLGVIGVVLQFVWPFLAVAFVFGITGEIIQVGIQPTTQQFEPKFNKFMPTAQKLRERLWPFSRQVAVNLIKALFKVIIIATLAYSITRNNFSNLVLMATRSIPDNVNMLAVLTLRLMVFTMLMLLIVSAIDYVYQRFEFMESMKMSKHEWKQEMKEIEGNPLIKNELRKRQQQLLQRRMLKEVPRADVVVTNPTHYAVALLYEPHRMEAPQVIAKGEGSIALRIREIARETNVPIIEKPELARALYSACEISDFIPQQLYSAVLTLQEFIDRVSEKMHRYQAQQVV